jgi:hypothetical protein
LALAKELRPKATPINPFGLLTNNVVDIQMVEVRGCKPFADSATYSIRIRYDKKYNFLTKKQYMKNDAIGIGGTHTMNDIVARANNQITWRESVLCPLDYADTIIRFQLIAYTPAGASAAKAKTEGGSRYESHTLGEALLKLDQLWAKPSFHIWVPFGLVGDDSACPRDMPVDPELGKLRLKVNWTQSPGFEPWTFHKKIVWMLETDVLIASAFQHCVNNGASNTISTAIMGELREYTFGVFTSFKEGKDFISAPIAKDASESDDAMRERKRYTLSRDVLQELRALIRIAPLIGHPLCAKIACGDIEQNNLVFVFYTQITAEMLYRQEFNQACTALRYFCQDICKPSGIFAGLEGSQADAKDDKLEEDELAQKKDIKSVYSKEDEERRQAALGILDDVLVAMIRFIHAEPHATTREHLLYLIRGRNAEAKAAVKEAREMGHAQSVLVEAQVLMQRRSLVYSALMGTTQEFALRRFCVLEDIFLFDDPRARMQIPAFFVDFKSASAATAQATSATAAVMGAAVDGIGSAVKGLGELFGLGKDGRVLDARPAAGDPNAPAAAARNVVAAAKHEAAAKQLAELRASGKASAAEIAAAEKGVAELAAAAAAPGAGRGSVTLAANDPSRSASAARARWQSIEEKGKEATREVNHRNAVLGRAGGAGGGDGGDAGGIDQEEEEEVESRRVAPVPLDLKNEDLQVADDLIKAVRNSHMMDAFWNEYAQHLRVSGQHMFEFPLKMAMKLLREKQWDKVDVVLTPFHKLRTLVVMIMWEEFSFSFELRRKLLDVIWREYRKKPVTNAQAHEIKMQRHTDRLLFIIDAVHLVTRTHPSFVGLTDKKRLNREASKLVTAMEKHSIVHALCYYLPLIPADKLIARMAPEVGEDLAHDLHVLRNYYAVKSITEMIDLLAAGKGVPSPQAQVTASQLLRTAREHITAMVKPEYQVTLLEKIYTLLFLTNKHWTRPQPERAGQKRRDPADEDECIIIRGDALAPTLTLLSETIDVLAKQPHHTEASRARLASMRVFVEEGHWRLQIVQNIHAMKGWSGATPISMSMLITPLHSMSKWFLKVGAYAHAEAHTRAHA